MPGYWPSALGAATKVRIGEPGSAMSAYSVVTTIYLFARNSGRDARAGQLLNLRDGLLLIETKRFRFTAEQFRKAVKVSAQQPLLRCLRIFVIFQNVKNALIDPRQSHAPGCFRMELFRLTCHVDCSPFRRWYPPPTVALLNAPQNPKTPTSTQCKTTGRSRFHFLPPS